MGVVKDNLEAVMKEKEASKELVDKIFREVKTTLMKDIDNQISVLNAKMDALIAKRDELFKIKNSIGDRFGDSFFKGEIERIVEEDKNNAKNTVYRGGKIR